MFVFVRLENIETKQAGARVRTVKTIPQAVAVFFEAVIFLALAPVSKLPGRHKLSLSIVFNIVLALGAQTIFGAQNLLPEASYRCNNTIYVDYDVYCLKPRENTPRV